MIDFFDRGARIARDRPCMIAGDIAKSYDEIAARSRRIAHLLIADGFAPGAHAAVLSGNALVAFEAILGILRADGVWAMANNRASVAENAYLFDLLDIDTLFVHSDAADRIPAFRQDCPNIRRYIALDRAFSEADFFLEDRLGDDAPVPQRRSGAADELGFLGNTGGTTGRSKGVMLTNGNWQALVSSLVASMPMKRPPVNLVAAPMTHAAGPLALASMALGGTVVVLPRFEPRAVLEAIEYHRVTYMFLPPTAVYMLLAHPGVRDFDLSSLEYISYAGAPMSVDRLKEAIDVLGPVMNASFGQTEAPMCVTAMPPHEHLDADGELAHPGSCGRPNLLSIVEIMDDDRNILGPNERGEIVVRGPLVMAGYYKNPEATAEVSKFGWHHTGDIGTRDEEGWFYVVDRKKDMIISGGFNVYPAEVEKALLAHPGVQDCAVIGVPDEKWGEAVIAFVEPRGKFDEAALIAFARDALGAVKTPKRIEAVASLPRTNAGKVSRAELRKPYWEQAGAADLMREARIIGVGMTPFGRHLDKTHTDLAQWAVKDALADAGIGPSDLQMAIYANVVQGFFAGEMSIPGEYALRPLGIQGVRVMNVEAACASSTVGLHVAIDYVRAGLADCVLVVGVEKLYSADRAKRFAVFQQPLDAGVAQAYLDATAGRLAPTPAGLDGPGPNIMMDAYAAQARLHMATYGTTQAQIAAVAAKNHAHSVHNPRAQYRDAMTVAEVIAAPNVAWPLTVPMCAPISDGAAAAVVCSAAFAARLGDDRAVRVLAAEQQSGSDRDAADYAKHVTRITSARAYEKAGIGPGDVDVAEVHDASSSGEIVQIEALGLCAPGGAGPAAEAGELSFGGRVPVNVSGGLVSKGHPLGATGLGQIFELVTQLRGEAGARQVDNARVALAENSGGFYGVEDGLSAVTILARP